MQNLNADVNHTVEVKDLEVVLERRHYSRLRHYWKGGTRGGASMTDNFDLDLAANGLIERKGDVSGVVYFVITAQGTRALADEKEREIARRKPHHDLGGRLAAWLRDQGRITWENIELLVKEEGAQQAIRPDVFSLVSTYNEKRINPCIYEVKVSRADFFADVSNPGKRAGYLKLSEFMYYVAPNGMLQVSEIPEECGLMVEEADGNFKILKKPKKRKAALTTHHFMNLILKPGKFNQL